MWIRLNSACSSPLSVRLPIRENGYTKWKVMTFDPGKEYEYDDDVAKVALDYTRSQKHTKEREQALKDANCVYELKTCRPCGGKRLDLVYHPIERA